MLFIELLSMVISALVSMHVEATWDRTKRQGIVLKVLKRFNIDPSNPPADFEGIYIYTLIEYGLGRPEPILRFFHHKFVREAFRASFYKNDPAILDKEAENLIEWNKETGKLGYIDYDPRREFATFSAVFHKIIDHTRTPAEVRLDQKLGYISEQFSQQKSEIIGALDELRIEIARSEQMYGPLLSPSSDVEVRVRGLLDAMGYRITDMQRTGADLYFLCNTKWGAEILQEVVHFVGGQPTANDIASLNDAVASYSAMRGILLTQHSLSPVLQELAQQRRHIQCYTLEVFTNRLANFEPYLQRLIEKYESSEVPQFYVPLTIQSEEGQFEPLESFLDTWLTVPERNHISILGDFGSGKTWFCQHYAYLAAKRYLADPINNRIPILITLRDYSRAYDVEQLITDAIVNRFKIGLAAGYKTFAQLNEAGRLLLIFDGFDEMERRVSDYRTKMENFWELAKVANQVGKVILTCRTPYFRHQSEEEEVLVPRRGRVSLAVGDQVINLHDRKGFEVVHMLDFTDEDIRLAVQRRLSTGWEEVYRRIEDVANLLDLASRPVLLDMIVKTLPQLHGSEPMNQAILYKTYVDTLLQQKWRKDTDSLSPQDRLSFMKELAWEMYQTQVLTIPFSEFPERVIRDFHLKNDPELAAYLERDIRTQSYLVRDDLGNYRFAHKSFLEYFVACKMAAALTELDGEHVIEIWRDWPLTPEMRNFLVDMVNEPDALWQLIDFTRNKSIAEVGYAGGNAATLLRLQGKVFVDADLSQTNLAGVDLYNCDLTGANLRDAYLCHANIKSSILADTDLRNADLTNVRLAEMGSVEGVMFDPSGEMIVSGSADGVVRLWRWATGEQMAHFFGGMPITSVCFSPCGRWILAGVGQHGHIKTWERANAQLTRTFVGHTGSVWEINFASGQSEFASCAHDGSVRIWDMKTGALVRVIHRKDRGIWDVCFSPDGASLAIAGGQELSIHHARTGALLWSLAQESELQSVKYSSRNVLAYTTREGKLYIYDALSKELLHEIKGAPVGPNTIAFSPDGHMLAVGGSGSSPKFQLWDVHTGLLVLDVSIGAHSYIGKMHWGPNGHLVSGCSDGAIRVWDVATTSSTFGHCVRMLEAKMNCQRMRIGGARGLDLPAPDHKTTLRDWFIARGALE